MQQMMDRVRDDFQEKQYYVTGNFSSELFTDECVASGRDAKTHTCASVQRHLLEGQSMMAVSVDTFLLYVQLPLRRPNSPSERCVFGWLTMSH